MPLDSVPVALNDNDHTQLDKLVLARNPPDDPTLLLLRVVGNSDGMLDQRYRDVTEADHLLEEYPELGERIKTAYAARSFKDIRTLEILQLSKPKRHSPPPATHGKAIAAAWDQPYRGNCAKTLWISLTKMQREGPYSSIVSIIQSSGTGKSRMVDQLARSVFAIPFNIRSANDNRDLAFPPPDDAVRTHIVSNALAAGTTAGGIECFYLCFLANLFSKTKDKLEGGRAKQQKGTLPLAGWWRDYLRQPDVRPQLYSSVIGEAEGFKAETVDVAARKAKDAFKELSVTIDSFNQSPAPAPKIILYFDEADTLMVPPPKNKPSYSGENPPDKYLYDILCSALNNLLSEPLLVLFLSTTSHLYQLAPSGPIARSARARSNIHNLQAPITETPFDCSPDPPVQPRQLTLENTCDVAFMSRFGRPLFWTMLQGAGDSKAEVMLTIINLARAKLLCQDAIDVRATDVDKRARTAVVDVRLMLDYEPRREASHQLQAELVASHMRICYSVPQSREYMRSGYPSEPILAEAAAQQMYAFRKRDPSAILNILRDNMAGGLLDRGERGELVGRELLMSAYDRAIEREDEARQRSESSLQGISTDDPASFTSPRSYSSGVSLITFIEELFTEENAHQVLESLPDNIKLETKFRDAFKDAKVRFTHFVKMGDDTGTTSAAAWVALARGMAIITQSGEVAVDVIIPILLYDEKLCEEVVSGLLVQFKRRRHSGSKASYLIDQRTIHFFPKGSGSDKRPYISLVMELGVQPKGTVPTNKLPKSAPPASTIPSKFHVTKQGRLRHPRDTHPRFSIFAYGCSNTVYKGISREQRETYQYVLASRDFLAEHPRQHRDALDAVSRMKPLWKVGSANYDWVDEKVLLGGVPDIATDNDDRLVTTFFDDDLEESGSGKDPFITPEPIQHREPSGLDSRHLHEAGSVGEEGRSGPRGGNEDIVVAPVPQPSGSGTSSRQKHDVGSGGEKGGSVPRGSSEDIVVATVPIKHPQRSRKKPRLGSSEKTRMQPRRKPQK